MESENRRFNYNYIIPRGNNYSSMPIGLGARISAYFDILTEQAKPKKGERLIKGKTPPKYSLALLLLICEKIQRKNLSTEGEQIGVEVSARELAKELVPPSYPNQINATTINNALNWLTENNWICKDTGRSKGHKTVITINLEKVLPFAQETDTPSYDYQLQEWENALNRGKT